MLIICELTNDPHFKRNLIQLYDLISLIYFQGIRGSYIILNRNYLGLFKFIQF